MGYLKSRRKILVVEGGNKTEARISLWLPQMDTTDNRELVENTLRIVTDYFFFFSALDVKGGRSVRPKRKDS